MFCTINKLIALHGAVVSSTVVKLSTFKYSIHSVWLLRDDRRGLRKGEAWANTRLVIMDSLALFLTGQHLNELSLLCTATHWLTVVHLARDWACLLDMYWQIPIYDVQTRWICPVLSTYTVTSHDIAFGQARSQKELHECAMLLELNWIRSMTTFLHLHEKCRQKAIGSSLDLPLWCRGERMKVHLSHAILKPINYVFKLNLKLTTYMLAKWGLP